VDLILVETEVVFVATNGGPAPKNDLETILADATGSGLTGYEATGEHFSRLVKKAALQLFVLVFRC
jgi:hypothetical protein